MLVHLAPAVTEPQTPEDSRTSSVIASDAAPLNRSGKASDLQSGGAATDAAADGRFWSAADLHELPWLAGDPAFDFRKLGVPERSADGVVDLELWVERDGRVHRCRVAASQGMPDLVGERLAAQFCTYQFNPGRVGGYPVASRVTVRVSISGDSALANLGAR